MKQLTFAISMLLCMMVISQNQINTNDLNSFITQADTDELIPVNIILKDKYPTSQLIANTRGFDNEQKRSLVVSTLKEFSAKSQISLISFLKEKEVVNKVVIDHAFWITNVISCRATKDVIRELNTRTDIEIIDLDDIRPMLIGKVDAEPVAPTKGVAEITPNVSVVNAPAVWDLGYTGLGVIVAVLDVGVNYNHVDLEDHMWEHDDYPFHGYDFAYNDNDPMDNHGHGTHCAGTVAGDGTAGSQTGMAPDATIMALKVLNDQGGGSESDSWEAIEFAVDYGAHVLSMSIGWMHAYNPQRATWRNTLDNALAAGIVAAIAAGNEGGSTNNPDDVRTPGDCPPPWLHPDQTLIGGISASVCVGATDNNDNLASFSARGPSSWETINPFNDYPFNPELGLLRPDVCAPGVSVKSCNAFNVNGYTSMSGTSMATPGVAGVMALLLSKVPSLTPEKVDIALETTAVDLGATGKDNMFGSGRIDALEAFNSLVEVFTPVNLQAATDQETGLSDLSWDHNGGVGFQYFKVYRDGEEIDTTSNLSYSDQLPEFGYFTYEVTAYYGGTDESDPAIRETQWGSSEVEITPLEVAVTVYPEQSENFDLIIKNNGILSLSFSLSPFFKNVMVADWITVTPDNGTVAPGDSLIIELNFDAEGYEIGSYDETLNFATNDLATSNVYVDLLMIVSDMEMTVTSDLSEICSGSSTGLYANVSGGTGTYEFSWFSVPEGFTSNEQNPLVSPDVNTQYFVTASDGNATIQKDISIQVNQSPMVDLGGNQTLCGETQTDLDAGNPGNTYLWSTSETTQSITATGSGETMFWAEVTNQQGCKGYDTIYIDFAEIPIVDIGIDTAICNNTSITLDAGNHGSTYLWSTNETTQTIVVDSTGVGIGTSEYGVTVTNQSGCIGDAEISVEFVDCTGINEFMDAILTVYPNPTTGVFSINIDSDSGAPVDLRVTDQSGKIVYQKTIVDISIDKSTSIDLSGLSNGVYNISIFKDGYSKSSRVILRN